MPAEQARAKSTAGLRLESLLPTGMRLEIRIDEARDPLRGEPIHARLGRRGARDVRERREVRPFARQQQELRMAVEQVLQQRGAAALMSADEHGAKQPLHGGIAFGAARKESSELARLAHRRARVVGELREQLGPGGCAAGSGQPRGDRRLHTDPISCRRHGRESISPLADPDSARRRRATRSDGVSERPLVSIVMPTYDRPELLPATVESIFAQTFRDWEIIVADDGSSAPAAEYLRALERSERVRLLSQPHSGNAGKMRNLGVQHARAPFIAFIDSDDVWAPAKLETQLAKMRAAPGCGWSYSAFVLVDTHGAPLPSERSRRWTPHQGHVFDEIVRGAVSIRSPSVVSVPRSSSAKSAGSTKRSIAPRISTCGHG